MRFLTFILIILAGARVMCQEKSYHIDVTKLDDGVYLYRSYGDYEGTTVSANGLVAEGTDSVVVMDTPWDNEQTIELLDWVERELKKPIAVFVITHAHADRIGGISVLNERGIPSIGSRLTHVYALKRGFEAPTSSFEKERVLKYNGLEVQVYYPGPGHTVDNSVVYLLPSNVLYGGCFLKSAGSTSLGNIADADLDSWPQSIENAQEKFPNPKMVIPGHGEYGPGAIENTLKLLGQR